MTFPYSRILIVIAALNLFGFHQVLASAAPSFAHQSPEDREGYVLTNVKIEQKSNGLVGTILAPCNSEYKGIALLPNPKTNGYFIAASMKKKAASCTGWPKTKSISLSFLPKHMRKLFLPFPAKQQKGAWIAKNTHNSAVSNKNGINWQELHVVYKAKQRSPILLMPNYENDGSVLRIAALFKKNSAKGKKQKFMLAKLPLSKVAKNRVLVGSEHSNSDIPKSFKLFSTKIHPAISRKSDGSLFTAVMPCGYIPLGVVLHKTPKGSSPHTSIYSAAGYKDQRVTNCTKDFEVYDIEMPMIAFNPEDMATFNPQTLPKSKEFSLVSPARIKWKNKNIYGKSTAYSLAYKTYNSCEQGLGTLFSVTANGGLQIGQVTKKSKTCTPNFKPNTHRVPAIFGSSWQGDAQGILLGSS